MKRDPSIWTKLSITTKDDRKVHGWYRTHDGMVTVETGLGSKTTQIGGSDPTNLACIGWCARPLQISSKLPNCSPNLALAALFAAFDTLIQAPSYGPQSLGSLSPVLLRWL